MCLQEAIYSAEKDVGQMNSRVQREQEDLQRRAATLADTGLKQEAEKQRLQLERQSWHDGEAERTRLDAAAREIKQQTQHLKVAPAASVVEPPADCETTPFLCWCSLSDADNSIKSGMVRVHLCTAIPCKQPLIRVQS